MSNVLGICSCSSDAAQPAVLFQHHTLDSDLQHLQSSLSPLCYKCYIIIASCFLGLATLLKTADFKNLRSNYKWRNVFFFYLSGGDVTITDLPQALKQIENNVLANIPSSCAHRSRVRALSWGSNHSHFPTDYDFVLGSDIVYLPETYTSLIHTLRHLSAQRATIYLSSKMRREHATVSFYEEILPQHFQCQLLHRNEEKNINLYKITKKEPKVREQE
ncbi:hypothetical protein chiPu_0021185 [Chiloscyllium punctatum]|uniref:Uncharacterized protein n=1 Tax=Chiloscyllium punctatum TaxID=137246 RepID=A0A401RP45_CHIPU|nr:hypothetical protein [Chiloscyllium punctatum]